MGLGLRLGVSPNPNPNSNPDPNPNPNPTPTPNPNPNEDAKTARQTRDMGAVGDRCFVTFRYAADATACLQAFAP